jgi:peptide/nickel transport system substrate-binding protein
MDAETAVHVQHYGKALRSSTLTSPLAEEYPEVAAATTRYDYDPARASQLLEEAGFVRGQDSFVVDRDGKRLTIDYRTFSGARGEQENAVFVDGLRRVGIDARQRPYSEAESRDGQALSTFPSLSFRGTGARAAMQMHISQQIPKQETRWQGTNYAAWNSPEYDRLFETYTTALDRREIVRLTAQMERMLTDEVPSIVHYFIPGVIAHLSTLAGPTVPVVPTGSGGWTEVYRWEWRA